LKRLIKHWLTVRVLLDEQLPRQLARLLTGHIVHTVPALGWAGLGNGELLRRSAAAGFDVFVTADQNLQFQQNLSRSLLPIIVLVAPSNTIEDLSLLVPLILQVIPKMQPGEVRRIALG
jgi:hypothetical protein